MDFERVSLLVGIIHNTLNIPGTELIRAEATKELLEINKALSAANPVAVDESAAAAVEPVEEEAPQEEIKLEGRRI